MTKDYIREQVCRLTKLGALCDKTLSEIVFYSTVKYSRTKSVIEHNVLAVRFKCNNRCILTGLINRKHYSVFNQHSVTEEKCQVFAVVNY